MGKYVSGTVAQQNGWLSARAVGRRLLISPRTAAVEAFARRWNIRRRLLEGSPTTYSAADVEAVAARVVIVGEGVAAGQAVTA